MATINAWNSNLPAEVSKGGTGQSTLTNHGLLVGAGTSGITQLANATNGQLPIGSNGVDPVLATITAGTGITVTNGAGSITIAANGSAVLETLTGNTGGAISPTAGNINIVVPAGASGTVLFNGSGSTLNLNFTDGAGNTAVGSNTLNVVTSGSSNTFLGNGSGTSLTTGSNNIGIGSAGLGNNVSGSSNIGIGNGAGGAMSSGGFNILVGRSAGTNYTGAESSNILLNAVSTSVAAESNVLRIGNGTGTGNQQLNAAFISGITGVNVGSTASVLTMGTGGTANKLGTATITAGTGISVTPGANTITIASTGSSSISITGDSGGALTGSSFTFTGGSTGLTFAGAGTTETLGGTLAIANGGTNATSMSTSTGIVKYDSTRLVTSSTAKIDSSNRQTNTSQPAFYAYLNSSVSNVTGDGTNYTVAYNATLYDQNSNFNTGTSTFTAPVTGIYYLNIGILGQSMLAASVPTVELVTTARTYTYGNNAGAFVGNNAYQAIWLVQMTAADTATVIFNVAGGTKTVGVYGSGASDSGRTFFSGHLVC